MAGHIQDRWYKTEVGADGKPGRVKTDRYGIGMRYRARYIGPDGTEKNKSFPDRKKEEAKTWLNNVEADMSRGQYLDPRAGKVTLREYATRWEASQTTDLKTREGVERHLRLHVVPYLGQYPLAALQPSHVRTWMRTLDDTVVSSTYRRHIFGTLAAMLAAAVDDGHMAKNPCRVDSIKPPKETSGRVTPWVADRVVAVREGLHKRYRAMVDVGAGCGLRQGEIFALSPDQLNREAGLLHVTHQVKMIGGDLLFAPPKGGKLRDVPLSRAVIAAMDKQAEQFPPVEITLPWGRPDGPLVTRQLYFTTTIGTALRLNVFNPRRWKPALAHAGVIPPLEPGATLYKEAREDGMHALRHFYASVLLDAGENIKALSHYLGHADPGFTLRVYTHLMPNSEVRSRRAIDDLFRGWGRDVPDGDEPDHESDGDEPEREEPDGP